VLKFLIGSVLILRAFIKFICELGTIMLSVFLFSFLKPIVFKLNNNMLGVIMLSVVSPNGLSSFVLFNL
jgi:hypothetical protein